jgi:thermitase
MSDERLIERVLEAEMRYQKDRVERDARKLQIKQLRAKRGKADWSVIDEGKRISARAQMLGIDPMDYPSGEAPELRVLERILADDDLLSADFLRVGARVSSCVGRIHIRDRQRRRAGFGTGFMISPRLLMTNNHVLKAAEDAANSTIEFDFVEGLLDSVQTSRFVSLDPARFFITSPRLDYTIVALGAEYEDAEAQRRGWLHLIEESGKVLVGERLNIVQHPQGGAQKVGLRRNELESVNGDYLIYSTDTEPGSSGSPVCNDQWLLAALHHAAVPETDSEGRLVRWVANEGVRISSIVADVRSRLRRSTESTHSLFGAAFTNVPAQVPAQVTGAPSGVARSDGSIEIPIRLTLQVSAAGVGGVATAAPVTTPGPVAALAPQVDAAGDGEFMDPPDGLSAFANPQLECLVVRVAEGQQSGSILAELAEGWEVEAVDEERSPLDYDLISRNELSVSETWSIVHALRADERLTLVEPSWLIDSVNGENRLTDASAELFGFTTSTDRAARDKHWAPDLISVTEAWDVQPDTPEGRSRGEGIRVAHPDSGYTNHPELTERDHSIDAESGFDFVSDDPNPFDVDGFHGTGTASVLMSGAGREILGVAPKATLVPMRIAQAGKLVRPAPVLLRSGMRYLRKAIALAIENDCHVVSISLGWFGHSALHDVVKRAWENDIIIVAAAGNYTGRLIVWPARYRECICMAGCDAKRGIWGGSARGSRIDFTAPGQDVWKAGFDEGASTTMQSSGTSFATAMTAGVAALWLSHHGRQNLIDRYSPHGVRLTEVFRKVIELSADPAPRYWFGGFGGIVNAETALQTALPSPQEVRQSFSQEAMTEGIDIPAGIGGPSLNTALEILGANNPEGRSQLADSLGVPEENLVDIANGCGDELAFHAALAKVGAATEARESLGASRLGRSQMSERLQRQLDQGESQGD